MYKYLEKSITLQINDNILNSSETKKSKRMKKGSECVKPAPKPSKGGSLSIGRIGRECTFLGVVSSRAYVKIGSFYVWSKSPKRGVYTKTRFFRVFHVFSCFFMFFTKLFIKYSLICGVIFKYLKNVFIYLLIRIY